MILEGVVILFVIGFIAVLFYKQANEQFEILQLEANRLHELPTLYDDHSPIVVRGFSVPNIATFEQLVKRKHIIQMALAPKQTLYSTLTDPNKLAKWTFVPLTTEFLAKESGLHVWFQMNMFPKLLPNPYTTWMYSFKTYLYPHHRGLYKTTAFQTIIMPTQGQARISIILQNAEAYFPVKWKERQFHHLSTQDTPLLSQIQFVEIKLKKGNLLILPSHFIVDIATDTSEKEDCWFMIAEIHHPISKLASIP